MRVLTPGLLTTVQDFGRPGLQHLGIPVGGALDPVSLRAANALVGNAPNAAALEVAYLGPTLLADADDVRLSIVGAHAEICIFPEGNAASSRRIAGNRSFRLRRGECVRIGSLSGGAVLYVAVEGGFDISPILGSASTCMRGGFGGIEGRALLAGDRLPLCQAKAERTRRQPAGRARSPASRPVPRDPGPQADFFSPAEIAAFFAADYTVSHGSDRMGMRLSGRKIQHARGYNIASDAIAPGAIQVPGDGAADRPARRPPDHRRLSEDRDGHFGRPSGTREAGDRHTIGVRRGERGRGGSGAPRPCRSACADSRTWSGRSA